MTMDLEQFKKNLLLHGTDVHDWPEEIKQAGLKALESSSEFQAVLEKEVRFERVLEGRIYEEPDKDFAERIVLAARPKKTSLWTHFSGFFSELIWEFDFPKPALSALSVSLVIVLLVGFTIGFTNTNGSISTETTQADIQEFLYYEGEVL